MHIFLRLVSILALVSAAAAAPAPAPKSRNIGPIEVEFDSRMIKVRVSGNTAELDALAKQAFGSHGRYFLATSGHAFDIRFSAVAANQVRVDITRTPGNTPVHSQVLAGPTARNALLRAADVAVEKTNGLGLRGFFNARLAFVSRRSGRSEIYVSDLMGGEVRQYTQSGAHVLTPRWSPDGGRLIYTSYHKSGAPDIYVQDIASGRQDTFVRLKGTNTGARFSPNGQHVVMVLTGSGVAEIYTSNAHGREITQRTRSDVVKSSPCWSPDGGQIAFAMGEPSPQLHIMGAGGGTARRLAVGFTYAAEPDWNRVDRNKLACTVRVGGGRYQVAVVDIATSKARVASKAPFDALEPVWLADGRHIIFTARDRTSSQLCILDSETGKVSPITERGHNAMQAGVWWQ